VDLEVDVCIQPNGAVQVLDLEKLEKALEKSFISKGLFEIVREKAHEMASAIVLRNLFLFSNHSFCSKNGQDDDGDCYH
jgi:predicted RNA-binding protein associated with RNAse of E/G family